MEIDIDRLHKIIEGDLKGRSSGQTTSELIQLAQSVEFLPGGHLGFISDRADSAAWEFRNILESLDIYSEVEVINNGRIIFKNGCRVTFIQRNNLQYSLMGNKYDNIFIDPAAEKTLSSSDFSNISLRLKPYSIQKG